MLSLRNKIEVVGNENQRQTKQAENIVIGFRKTNTQKSVFYESVKIP